MKELGRLLTAMVTPFNERGEVDYEQAKKLALALLDSGSDGLVVAATTGEAPTLTWEEEMRLFTEVKSAVGDRCAVIAYTGSNNTAEAVEATVGAEKTGVDGCLSVVRWRACDRRIDHGRRRPGRLRRAAPIRPGSWFRRPGANRRNRGHEAPAGLRPAAIEARFPCDVGSRRLARRGQYAVVLRRARSATPRRLACR